MMDSSKMHMSLLKDPYSTFCCLLSNPGASFLPLFVSYPLISSRSRNAIILSRSQGSSTPVVTFHYDMLFVLLLHNRRGHAYIMSAKYLDFQLTTFMHCLFINLGPFISSPPPSVLTWYLYGTLGR